MCLTIISYDIDTDWLHAILIVDTKYKLCLLRKVHISTENFKRLELEIGKRSRNFIFIQDEGSMHRARYIQYTYTVWATIIIIIIIILRLFCDSFLLVGWFWPVLLIHFDFAVYILKNNTDLPHTLSQLNDNQTIKSIWLAALNFFVDDAVAYVYLRMGNFQLENSSKRQPSDDLQMKCDWWNDSSKYVTTAGPFPYNSKFHCVNGWHLLKHILPVRLLYAIFPCDSSYVLAVCSCVYL